MITSQIDMKELERDLVKTAALFGEANETGIARWGVAIGRRVIKETQVWGDGKAAKTKHEDAMTRDVKRVAIVLQDPKLTRLVDRKKLGGLTVKGEKFTFNPRQNITTAKGLNDWIDLNRSKKSGRPPKQGLKNGTICVTTGKVVMQAMRERFKRIGKAKGGWIGAGQGIGVFQKIGSRLTIGKNVASYAHKFKSSGRASMKKDQWNPEGTMINSVPYSSDPHVLKHDQLQKAIIDGGKNTITWYEKSMQGRLNKKR